MPDLQPVYDELVRRLSVHEDVFRATGNVTEANCDGGRKEAQASDPGSYLLLGAPYRTYSDGFMFAGVRLSKRYVSYHLMCAYLRPEMVEGPSPQLRKRLQGKSCFRSTSVDHELFDELDDLTRRGRELFAAEGLTLHR
ncbi:hypothetical protein [Arsenicicoccus sp. oral taxon 190]|uniref:hypothetical protein n=1 Tax=Arsenicicoccus sp. oral taxon 190 TaxID=1658671 RepID=UPI00067C7DA4|nr:hypothetical protein [Arsenicicoccus sp. oral taxon 190]